MLCYVSRHDDVAGEAPVRNHGSMPLTAREAGSFLPDWQRGHLHSIRFVNAAAQSDSDAVGGFPALQHTPIPARLLMINSLCETFY